MADKAYPPQQGYPQQQGNPPQQGYPPQQGHPPQQVPVTQMVVRDPQNRADDYLIFAILVTIFFCWPMGIVAIIKALKVRSLNDLGDYASAQRASQEAKNWSIATLICGIANAAIAIVFIIVYLVIAAAVTTASVNNAVGNLNDNFS